MSNIFDFSHVNFNYLTLILFLLLLIWLVVLTILLNRQKKYYKKLFNETDGKELKEILESHLGRVAKVSQRMGDLEAIMKRIQEESNFYFQKIGFVRFNPFRETGGDQSFILALLDKKNNGIVISSLHGRNQTRLFAKTVKEGKAEKHTFSAEEESAVKKAIIQK
ncbi:hypothetical protein COS81_03960 [candidate division WWE3 bacterium CG06_land_8_20_14_3_00_42_16]|uniref:DUF4446 domain-containing protein n=3 Tax=Katanobacteria TaxID=422282 RepID=A0A2M7AM05_UNCKA|nr:MAG: hypothetical protein COS81_03960 [candidate division WWE3 bacterium CG06_land_8_20_14_3_00_42_16]PIZ43410.1 MAG: hypothetical protein COY34_00965 [candidate division WWE3 bacterium CG_4_10_14_0_2_um_filter_42_8]PJC68605.1 MAG: hypothetical protein CO015_03430 [candidate division WWE3 bacterium CG_4_8_14_3_um_filter_42_11]